MLHYHLHKIELIQSSQNKIHNKPISKTPFSHTYSAQQPAQPPNFHFHKNTQPPLNKAKSPNPRTLISTKSFKLWIKLQHHNTDPYNPDTQPNNNQQESSQIRLKSEPGNESKIRDCLGDIPETREADSKKSKNLSRILEKQTLSSPDSIRFCEREP